MKICFTAGGGSLGRCARNAHRDCDRVVVPASGTKSVVTCRDHVFNCGRPHFLQLPTGRQTTTMTGTME